MNAALKELNKLRNFYQFVIGVQGYGFAPIWYILWCKGHGVIHI